MYVCLLYIYVHLFTWLRHANEWGRAAGGVSTDRSGRSSAQGSLREQLAALMRAALNCTIAIYGSC